MKTTEQTKDRYNIHIYRGNNCFYTMTYLVGRKTGKEYYSWNYNITAPTKEQIIDKINRIYHLDNADYQDIAIIDKTQEEV